MGSNLAQIKKMFFDRKSVLAATDKATRAALSRFGAFVRTRSRTSIRTKKGISPPGSPPYSHRGTLKKGILFSFDPERRSVVIGPTQMGRSGDGARVLEEGGTSRVPGVRGGRPLTYQARPYMKPAFDAELPKAIQQFKGLIRG